MLPVHRDIRQRPQNELAFGQPRMRQNKFGCFENFGAVKKYIDIDRAWAVMESRLAAQFGFELLDRPQKGDG